MKISYPYRKWISLSSFVGFVVFLLYLYFFTDIVGVASIIGRTNIFLYSLAFICVLVAVSFTALAWHCLLKTLEIKVSYRLVFNLSWVGIFVDSIVPGGGSGDAFMVYLLSGNQKIAGGKAAASIVMKNVLELLTIMLLSFVGLILLALNYSLESGVLLTIGTTMILLAFPLMVIVYLSVNIGATKKILRMLKRLQAFIRRRPANIEEFEKNISGKLKEYHDGLAALKANPKQLVQTVFFETVAWSFEIIALFLIFTSINFPITADKIIITNTIAINLNAQGIALAGFSQVVTSSVYTILGIPLNYSAASTVLSAFALFWFKLIISFFVFQFIVFSRCVPPYCTRESILRGEKPERQKLSAQPTAVNEPMHAATGPSAQPQYIIEQVPSRDNFCVATGVP